MSAVTAIIGTASWGPKKMTSGGSSMIDVPKPTMPPMVPATTPTARTTIHSMRRHCRRSSARAGGGEARPVALRGEPAREPWRGIAPPYFREAEVDVFEGDCAREVGKIERLGGSLAIERLIEAAGDPRQRAQPALGEPGVAAVVEAALDH